MVCVLSRYVFTRNRRTLGKMGFNIKDVPKHQIMNNTNTQALTNYEKAAEEIIIIFDNLGFTTETPLDDVRELKDYIVEAIRRNVEKKEITQAPAMYSITDSYLSPPPFTLYGG